jgi:hypothetical protein
MIALLWFVLAVVAAPFKSKCRLELAAANTAAGSMLDQRRPAAPGCSTASRQISERPKNTLLRLKWAPRTFGAPQFANDGTKLFVPRNAIIA